MVMIVSDDDGGDDRYKSYPDVQGSYLYVMKMETDHEKRHGKSNQNPLHKLNLISC